MILRVGLYTIASVLMAAHFLRQGNWLLAALCALLPLLFLYRKGWVLVALQVAAYAAAAIWVVTAVQLVQERIAMGRSWTAAVIILGAVALFTALSGALLNSRAIRQKYPR
jgi:hypothetical protein